MWAARVHVYMCVYICESKGDVAFTPPGACGNANHSDDTVISVPLNDTDLIIQVGEGWVQRAKSKSRVRSYPTNIN